MSDDYPPAIWFPAHPTNILGPPCHPKGIVLHTPEEFADGYPATPHWFSQAHPDRAGSTHYFAAATGTMYQCVREKDAAIANGVTKDKPYPSWANKNVSLNRQTTNIEIEGYAATIGQTMPRGSVQWKALIDWIVFECQKWDIPCDREHIIGHYQVASNRSDPGTLNIDAVVADAQAQMIEEDDMFTDDDRKTQNLIKQALLDSGANDETNPEGDRRIIRISKATSHADVELDTVLTKLNEVLTRLTVMEEFLGV